MGNDETVSGESDIPACTHGDNDAVHAEYQTWAEGWAKKLHSEAPPESDGRDAHHHHELKRVWDGEMLATLPERFRKCVLYPKLLIKDALMGIHHAHDVGAVR